ncbi:hypothetical protein OB981_28050 [Bacillus cereus]|nr:hypothetical protein [Bacillus cereus]
MDKDIEKDCRTLKEEFSKRGINITLLEAETIWQEYCQLIYFATWLPVGGEITHHVFNDLLDLDFTKEIINK